MAGCQDAAQRWLMSAATSARDLSTAAAHHGAAAAQLGLALGVGPRHLAQAQQSHQDVLQDRVERERGYS